MPRTLAEEYEICQDRGHIAGRTILMGERRVSDCAKCQTRYWTENVLHETNVPPDVATNDSESQRNEASSILSANEAIEETLRRERAARKGGGADT